MEFQIRQANDNDFKGLLDFYVQNKSPKLPPPSAKTVGDAIAQNRILLVESQSIGGPPIVASGALFQISPTQALNYVGELAGMRSTGIVGGLEPISMQIVLLGLRLLGFVALEPKARKGGFTNSIIAYVKRSNLKSIANVELIKMKPLAERPDWLKYDEHAWNGTTVEKEWNYYCADIETISEAIRLLSSVGLFDDEIRLHRTDRGTSRQQDFTFKLALPHFELTKGDLNAILASGAGVDLVPPPDTLLFEPHLEPRVFRRPRRPAH